MTTKALNTDKTFNLRDGAVKIEFSAFFRGMSYSQDAILALTNVQSKAKLNPYQFAMVQGMQFEDGGKYHCTGENRLEMVFFSMPETVDETVKKIYDALLDFTADKDIAAEHWLNNYDQYEKIQVRHRINGGEWSDLYADTAMAA